MTKPYWQIEWENKIETTLENFKSKDDFKNYFNQEIVEGEDPYFFQSPRGDGYPGEGISCLFSFLKQQTAKKSLEKLSIFLEAIVENILDEKIFHIAEKMDKTRPSGFTLYGITHKVPKNNSLAEKVLQKIRIKDIIKGKIEENSPNYLHQQCLVGLYFDLLPTEKYDFELIDKLGDNLPFASVLFYSAIKADKEKSKNLAKNYARYEINKKNKEMAQWILKKYYPKDKDIAKFLRGLK
ncbi:MAG: hypothetical protein AABX39_01740 [Nanoarchaeota archaeon]